MAAQAPLADVVAEAMARVAEKLAATERLVKSQGSMLRKMAGG